MKMSTLRKTIFAVGLVAVLPVATADQTTAQDTSAPVVVHGATPLAPIAPAWQQGRNYKFGDLANYDGYAFKAKSGSAHIRPDVASEVGWEKLNACDDKSKGAVQCELSDQAKVVDTQEAAQREYEKVKQDMTKGKPVNATSQ